MPVSHFRKPAALKDFLLLITVNTPTCSLPARDRQTRVVCSANRSGRRDACLACVAAGAVRPDSQAATDLASVFCCVKQALPFSSGPGVVRSRTCVRVITASRESGVCRPNMYRHIIPYAVRAVGACTCRENSSGSAFRPQTAAISASPRSCGWPAIATASMGSHNRYIQANILHVQSNASKLNHVFMQFHWNAGNTHANLVNASQRG